MKVKIIIGLLFILVLSFGCKKESTLEIDYPAPVPNFEITYGAEGEVLFTNTSKNAISFNWDFGNGNTSSSDSFTLSNTYQNKGSYNVTLTAKNVEGETASITKQIITTTEPWKPKNYKKVKISKFEVVNHPAANLAMAFILESSQAAILNGSPIGYVLSRNDGVSWNATVPYVVQNLDDGYVFRLFHYEKSENKYYIIHSFSIKFSNYKTFFEGNNPYPTSLFLRDSLDLFPTVSARITLEWIE